MIQWFDSAPRRILAIVCITCLGMLAFGLYLQHVVGLEPCPMCIVQRYCLVLVALVAGVSGALRARAAHLAGAFLVLLFSGFGAYVAARQSWLQWHPPETVSCGRDFYGMIETFPLKRAIPMIFKGGGDCSKVDWTFLTLSIANWSFLVFVGLTVIALVLLARRVGSRSGVGAQFA
ncbi:MAG: disulfide bond formation protein B [Ramlibacter sp.]